MGKRKEAATFPPLQTGATAAQQVEYINTLLSKRARCEIDFTALAMLFVDAQAENFSTADRPACPSDPDAKRAHRNAMMRFFKRHFRALLECRHGQGERDPAVGD
jgi:hypothetical protein